MEEHVESFEENYHMYNKDMPFLDKINQVQQQNDQLEYQLLHDRLLPKQKKIKVIQSHLS